MGVPARQEGVRNLDVDLGNIKYIIAAERTKRGIRKAISKEDYFMMT